MTKVDEFIEKLRSLTYSYESRFRMEEVVSELLSTLNTYDPEKECVVPREPSKEMIEAAAHSTCSNFFQFNRRDSVTIYKAMLKAAQGE